MPEEISAASRRPSAANQILARRVPHQSKILANELEKIMVGELVPAYPAMTPLTVLGVLSFGAESYRKTNCSLTFKTCRVRVTVPGFLQNSFIWSS